MRERAVGPMEHAANLDVRRGGRPGDAETIHHPSDHFEGYIPMLR
jgi:hypothetical protein